MVGVVPILVVVVTVVSLAVVIAVTVLVLVVVVGCCCCCGYVLNRHSCGCGGCGPRGDVGQGGWLLW